MKKKIVTLMCALAMALGLSVASAPSALAETDRVCLSIKSPSNVDVVIDVGIFYLGRMWNKTVHKGYCSDYYLPNGQIQWFILPSHHTCVSQWGGVYLPDKYYYWKSTMNGALTFKCTYNTTY